MSGGVSKNVAFSFALDVIRRIQIFSRSMQVTLNGLQFYYDDEAEYPAGYILLREGQSQSCIYVLKKGSVKILKHG